MNDENFENNVKQGLESLNFQQRRDFAWRCGISALPFLGAEGHFNFWNVNNRQKNIYAIFFALDVSSGSDHTSSTNALAYAAAFSAAGEATQSLPQSAAAYAAAYVAHTADARSSADASTAAIQTAIYAVIAANKYGIDLNPIILNELIRIKTKSIEYVRVGGYGEIWDNFQKALKNEGCSYWGHVYQHIFDNGLVVDITEVKRRLNVPDGIRKQGAASVAGYLEELEKGATQFNEARIIILGEKGAGKTCVARRLVNPEARMTTHNESTAGVDTTVWKPDESDINVRIWDFAGHTVTHAVHQFFLSERCLYLLVYDGRTEERNRPTYWLDHMKNYGGNSSAIILVNKRDYHTVDIPINSLKEKYSIADIYTFSIQDDKEDLLAFRKKVAKYINANPSWEKTLIPNSYFQVKAVLEERFKKDEAGSDQEHITRDEFNNIAEQFGVDGEDTEKLLGNLHALGVSLWYQEMEHFNTLVLNPEWISHGVYQIINWANEAKKYALSMADLATVFYENRNRYPEDKDAFLFELMRHFELAYQVKDEEKIIIPHLLNEDRPKQLPEFPIGEALMIRYCAEQPLPPHTISRFIVRHNQEIKMEGTNYRVWRYGVVLEKENTIALVREEDRTISVSVKGPKETSYISELRETLNDIFNSYKSDKPDLQYRVERHGLIPSELKELDPLWLSLKKILNHIRRNKHYFDDETGLEISLEATVNNYNMHTAIFGGHGHTVNSFHNCNIILQDSLNKLALLFAENGNAEEAKELKKIVDVLEMAKNCKDQEELKKSDVMNRVKRLIDNVNDISSKLHKTAKNIKNGMDIVQDITKHFNEWVQFINSFYT